MGKINNINRRKFIEIFAGCGCSIAIAGCTTAPITDRKQLKLIPEVTLNNQAAQIYQKLQRKTKLSDDKRQLDEIKDIGSETLYFIVSVLNYLDLDKIRNKLVLKVLPLKVKNL